MKSPSLPVETDPGRFQEPLSGHERRQAILELLAVHGGAITGTELAKRFQVSRQSIVQDMAILRAGGSQILSTPQGYLLPKTKRSVHQVVLASRHTFEETAAELNTLVDLGVKVLDVIVEHPLYGELRGLLMLESRADVKEFIERVEESGAKLLSSLTGGVHLHTVEASRPELIEKAKEGLRDRGFLLEEQERGS